jgi:uncharacterized protein YaaW (UPF0174 family)
VSLGAASRVPRYSALARQRPSLGGVKATVAVPPLATTERRRLNCQPANGSKRSIVIRTGPATAGLTCTAMRTARPGADWAEVLPSIVMLARVTARAARCST